VGVKQTGNGHRERGWEVYDFYSETKTIHVDFSGTLQRAQIDTYPKLTNANATGYRHDAMKK
jgi:hypothetical protein